MDHFNSGGSIELQIHDLKRLSDVGEPGPTLFEPQDIEKRESGVGLMGQEVTMRAPEKMLTLFALRLAILEKAATGLGTLGFIWATVVLLGGFAITLDKTDFWFITIILLIEGTRIFSRSHELEWQHQSTWSITNYPQIEIWSTKKPASRQWNTSDVPFLPYIQWVFLSKNISKLLHWLQIIAAMACVVLSSIKLIKHNYGDVKHGSEKRNLKAALVIFYSLALAEALLFLLEKAYWEIKVTHYRVLEDVCRECELGLQGLVSVKRFFYDAYSKCLSGSIFDGLTMDMVSFAMELVGSNSSEEQVIGARILRKFAMNERFSDDTLQKIGVTLSVVERLVEMLNWKDPQEEEIRQSSAIILSKLAGKKQNSLRVAGIPGAMESISSLLYANTNTFNHLGLLIIKKLARSHDNCGKIGNARGLLPRIIDFTHVEENVLQDENVTSNILTVKRSLQVLRMLASTTGKMGKQLRQEMSECVFTVSNVRNILKYGEKHPNLQHLGIQILTNLALEADATERIGGTGGIIDELLKIFFDEGVEKDECHVRIAAGEALAMLALESKSNCLRILKTTSALDELVEALEVELIRENAARILMNLCTYIGDECFVKLRRVVDAIPTVIKGIMSEESKLQEVMVGLAAHTFKFMTLEESSFMFENAGITENQLCYTLVQLLKKYPNPPIQIPRIRRFTIELMIWMMKNTETSKEFLRNLELNKELENVLDTTTEIESFNIFSGTVGLCRFKTNIHSLVEMAMELLAD
ncbi:hypothetical protein V2J09_013411 [Rumex salicifolius]